MMIQTAHCLTLSSWRAAETSMSVGESPEPVVGLDVVVIDMAKWLNTQKDVYMQIQVCDVRGVKVNATHFHEFESK